MDDSRKTQGMDVAYVAHLARLNLTPDEVQRFQGQLNDILAYVEELKEVDVTGVEPTAHATRVENILRADDVRSCLDRDDVLKNAPAKAGGQFLVPKILD